MKLDELGGWSAVLGKLASHQDLTSDEAHAAMAAILTGETTDAQIGAYIVALRLKGETPEELRGMVDAMLDAAEVVPLDLDGADGVVLDVVGTGGDRSHTINVSTLAALVVAGAGGRVCKHGNRAASSATGTADVLEALGVRLDPSPEQVARCVREAGIGFCFAPRFHPAMRHVGPARKQMGIPTAFNILGPLANPGRVRHMMVGVADGNMAERMLGVLAARGCAHALVVHGDDGLDELTLSTTSTVLELRDGDVRSYQVSPEDAGLPRAPVAEFTGGDPATNAELARKVLAGEHGPRRDVVVFNAGAALTVAGLADDLPSGVAKAQEAIDAGWATKALDRLITLSNEST